jgi:hypothetical protein
MPDPTTPAEWQDAVDAAKFFLMMDSAKKFGFIAGGPEVNLAKCEEILRRGAEIGFMPAGTSTLIKKFLEAA